MQVKLVLRDIVKISRLVFQMLFISFYVGQYWFIISEAMHRFFISDGEQQDYFGHHEGSWSFEDLSPMKKIITNSYFAFTTMSTVGFGDYYPVSNAERIFGSFLLLFGVAIFSFIMGELLDMITKFKHINAEFNMEDQLEQFFKIMRKYNEGNSLP